MFRKWKQLFLLAFPLLLGACESIHEGLDPCEVYLEFRFDHNMEYTCSFTKQVPTVDVYVFDAEGRYLFTKHAETSSLINGNRMSLAADLDFGTYKVLTVGGLCDKFSLTAGNRQSLVPGATTLQEVQLALERESDVVSHEFPHLWFGKAVTITYSGGMTESSVWPVSLIRNTNNFNLVVATLDGSRSTRAGNAPYTFKVVTPEAAVYGHDNSPLTRKTTTYMPHTLNKGTGAGSLSTGYLNTVRLFYPDEDGYRLIVEDTRTSEEAWNYDLMDLLEQTKPASRPDGTALPMQEYLDRQGEWDIVVLYKESEGPGPFLPVAVEVNGWIIWLTDIEV